MRAIKFRQPLFNQDGTFNSWHYWGWITEGKFVSPLSMGHNVKGVLGLQFTGLNDKNGKEIFDGDIIRGFDWHNCKPSVVSWDVIGFRIPLMANAYEIIGNIYENPELIKGDK